MSSHQESRSPIPSTLFRPGTGARPPFLAGRAAEQRILAGAAEELDEKGERGRIPRNIILYGPRGNGKAALMLWLQDFAAAEPRVGCPCESAPGRAGTAPMHSPGGWRPSLGEKSDGARVECVRPGLRAAPSCPTRWRLERHPDVGLPVRLRKPARRLSYRSRAPARSG